MSSATAASRARRRARDRFTAIAEGPDATLDLGEAMALIAAEDDPRAAVVEQLRVLDRMADRLRKSVTAASDPRARLELLTQGLFDEYGFRGNTEDYYLATNSYLHEVLRRRVGIPVSLSIVLIEVGRRLGMAMEGVGFPAHFLACDLDVPDVYVDAFHGGALMDGEGCRAMLDAMTSGQLPFKPEMLEPITTREILVRVLSNLKSIYVRQQALVLSLAAVDRILLLNPADTGQLRDRGLINLRGGRYGDAIEDLELYLDVNPRADDRMRVQAHIVEAREKLGRR